MIFKSRWTPVTCYPYRIIKSFPQNKIKISLELDVLNLNGFFQLALTLSVDCIFVACLCVYRGLMIIIIIDFKPSILLFKDLR